MCSSSPVDKRLKNLQAEAFLALPLKGTKRANASTHIGLLWLLRSWVSISLRRRSVALLAKSTALAAKFKIPMNILFDAEDGEGSMAHCSALLLSPNPRADQLAGPPLQLSEIASSLLSGVQMEKPGLLVARNEENGLVRFFVSEEFEVRVTL